MLCLTWNTYDFKLLYKGNKIYLYTFVYFVNMYNLYYFYQFCYFYCYYLDLCLMYHCIIAHVWYLRWSRVHCFILVTTIVTTVINCFQMSRCHCESFVLNVEKKPHNNLQVSEVTLFDSFMWRGNHSWRPRDHFFHRRRILSQPRTEEIWIVITYLYVTVPFCSVTFGV